MLKLLRLADIPLRVAAVIAAAYLLYVFLARHSATRRWDARQQAPMAAANSPSDSVYAGTDLRILQFYARDGALLEGHGTVVCYGVLNARSVTIDPPLQGVSVSLNRCVDAAPEHDTRYTLTAEGNDGRTVSASFAVTVKPDVDSLPRITSFGIAKHVVERGRHIFTLAFSFQNGKDVSIDPPVFSTIQDSAPFGQFFVSPDRTTTYTLTVAGKFGHKAQKQLTLEIP